MESAFTGLVRKHRVPFRPNESITSHNTIIAVLSGFLAGPCVLFFLDPLPLAVSVSPPPYSRHPRSSVGATGMKERQSKGSLTRTNQPTDAEGTRGRAVESVKHSLKPVSIKKLQKKIRKDLPGVKTIHFSNQM